MSSSSSLTYDSARPRTPSVEQLVEAWRYRDLIRQLVERDVKTRYKRSVIGIAWTMLNPLLMMVILTTVFSTLFRFQVEHYPVYLLSGLILWSFFAQSTTGAMSHLLWGAALMKKIRVPPTVFAIATVGTGLVNLVISIVPLIVIAVLTGVALGPALIWLIPAIFVAACFALGVGLLVSTLGAQYADVVEMYQVLVTAWYFLTPVFYPASIMPPESAWILRANPMHYIVETFRAPIYASSGPEPVVLLVAAATSLAMLALGWTLFARRADDLAYQL